MMIGNCTSGLILFTAWESALVTNTPLQSGEGYKLCERVGYHKTIHYGYVTFRVLVHFV